MTLKQLIYNILEIAKEKPNIRTAQEGNIYDLNNMPDVEYNVFWLTQGQHRVGESTITYNFNMFYVNRLSDNLDNKIDIQSDGIVELVNIINSIVDELDVEVEYPLNFIPFNQRFLEDCSGVYTSVNIVVDNELGNCYWE